MSEKSFQKFTNVLLCEPADLHKQSFRCRVSVVGRHGDESSVRQVRVTDIRLFFLQVTPGQKPLPMWCSGGPPAPSPPPSSFLTVKTSWTLPNWCTRRRWTDKEGAHARAFAREALWYLIFMVFVFRTAASSRVLPPKPVHFSLTTVFAAFGVCLSVYTQISCLYSVPAVYFL